MKKKYLFLFLFGMLAINVKIEAQAKCTASFYLDKAASAPFNAVIVNTSTETNIIAPDSMIYKWKWNDGSAVTYGKYPTHTYTVTGPRSIRLEIRNSLNTCSDSMMLTFVIDTNGVFHKTNTDYNIRVVAPPPSGINKDAQTELKSPSVNIIKDLAIVSFPNDQNGKMANGNLYTFDGRKILSVGEEIRSNSIRIPASTLPEGMYVLRIIVEGRLITLKILK